MLQNRYIAKFLLCGLFFCLLHDIEGANSIAPPCPPKDVQCLYKLIEESKRKQAGGTQDINNQSRILLKNQIQVGEHTINISVEDLQQCGSYPACSITYLKDRLWSYVCDQALVSFTVAMNILLCIIVVGSNLVIIVVTLRTKTLRKPHGYFKLSLAAADLIAGLFVLPSIIHNTLNGMHYDKQLYNTTDIIPIARGIDQAYSTAGDFFGAAGLLTAITGIYSLLLISIDSFLSVWWPMQYRIGDIMNSKRAFGAVLFIWIVGLCVAFLPLLAKDYLVYGLAYYTFQYVPIVKQLPNTNGNDSTAYKYLHALVYAVLVWGLPFLITWILTIITSFRSRKMLKNMKASRKNTKSAEALNKVERELARTVVIVLSLFTITVLPVFGVMLKVILKPPGHCFNHVTTTAFFISSYVFICGRFLNVIVYNVFSKEFRAACLNFFVSIVHFVFCYDEIEEGLMTKSSSAEKKGVSNWGTSKFKTKETRLSENTASASTSVLEK